jgi:hypothetical protein
MSNHSFRNVLQYRGSLPLTRQRTKKTVGAKLTYHEYEIRLTHHVHWYDTIAPTEKKCVRSRLHT